jgi:hypothetical protein
VEQKPWEVDKRWPDPAFMQNRVITLEIVKTYGGMYVAWSRDGTRILDADANESLLNEKLRKAGVEQLDYVIDYVDRPDEGNW